MRDFPGFTPAAKFDTFKFSLLNPTFDKHGFYSFIIYGCNKTNICTAVSETSGNINLQFLKIDTMWCPWKSKHRGLLETILPFLDKMLFVLNETCTTKVM